MAVYRLDLDLLEAAKQEYIGSAEKMNADIFRKDFTGYVNKDFTESWETMSKIGTALENGLDDARECKKLCNDFPTALGGVGNGRGKEDMRGELYCDQPMISTLKACCMSVMLHAQENRVLSRVTDMIFGELQEVEEMSNGEVMERVKDAWLVYRETYAIEDENSGNFIDKRYYKNGKKSITKDKTIDSK